ncbi:hypothetical protein [Bradyrhizobium pachyrhizi]|uniref:hypothetical protein n=1 Tax=Bradyrhizobium pachyrhizi TaxID=280333 RepID=UPI000A69C64C|nr:hypothetical protein [Bradyrhizobium pachyrhizi]
MDEELAALVEVAAFQEMLLAPHVQRGFHEHRFERREKRSNPVVLSTMDPAAGAYGTSRAG